MKLPPKWRTVRISDFGKVVTGNTPPTNDETNFGGPIPFVTPGDMGNPGLILSAQRTLSISGCKRARLVPASSTLVVCIGSTIGKVGLAGTELATNQQINAVVPSENVDGRFAFYEIGRVASTIRRLAGTQAVPIISKGEFEDFPATLPPLPEQQKIADILGTWDEALEKLDALIAAKARRKQALMQQLLTGHRRLPGFSKPWVKSKLGELFLNRTENNRLDLPLLSITADQGVVSRDSLTKRDTSSEDKSKYLRIAPGDIGYNTMRMWQGVSALSSLEGIVSPAYTILTPTDRIDGKFAAHFFKLPHTISFFHRYSQGLVDDTLNLKFPAFAVIEVTVPTDVSEQRAIAAVLDTADAELPSSASNAPPSTTKNAASCNNSSPARSAHYE